MSSPRTQQALERLAGLTPKQIVEELDRYIVGQADAKKAVAIALRNRWRRQRAPESIREEISPNNIILVGPTGVGKTEIARRLARLAGAPFVKVEASKFTEVGYVGRDVESMVRDLVESAINMVRAEREGEVQEIAKKKVDERLLDLLLPVPPDIKQAAPTPSAAAGGAHLFVVSPGGSVSTETDASEVRYKRTREKLKQLLDDGQMDDREIEIEVTQQAPVMFDMMVPSARSAGRSRSPRRVESSSAKSWRSLSTRKTSPPMRWSACRRWASYSSTKLIKSPDNAARTWADRTSRAREFSATCCPSSKARTCRRSTAW